MEREPNTEYVLSLSYGKDSCACIGAIEKLGLPLDRIIHAEVWATDTIPADLPPMVEFKEKADEIIYKRTGIKVEHLCAKIGGGLRTYERMFYHVGDGKYGEQIYGFPCQIKPWCNSKLKCEGMSEKNIRESVLQRTLAQENDRELEYIRISDTKRELVYKRTQNEIFK